MIDTISNDFWVLFFTIIIAIGTIIIIKDEIKRWINKVIKWGLRENHSLKSFDQRGDATKMMFEDMKRANELVFLGISNSTLHEYFAEVINDTGKNDKILPFEKISIFFASDDVGKTWEGNLFGDNIIQTIIKISNLFTPEFALFKPSLQISFRQNSIMSCHGGSLFKLPLDKDNFSVIYVVLYLPISADTKTAHTLWLSAKNKDPLNLYEFYSNYYKIIKNKSNLLYEFEYGNNMWDFSSEEWDKFEENYPIYSQVMEDLIEFGEILPNYTVLDIGCGTGHASEKLVKKIENGSILLLDKSPKMIEKAKQLLGKYGNVKFILADAKKKNPLYGAFQNAKFYRIVIHFSFQHFIDRSCSIQLFAKNWKRYLENDGDILIAIHNSFIECTPPVGYKEWVDPLRDELTVIAHDMGLTVKKDLRKKFTIDEMNREFENAGFYLKDKISKEYPRTMEDRIAMWKVPAVIDSLLDIEPNDSQNKSKLLDTVRQRIKGEDTMPTTVVFFRFSLRDKRDGKT